MSDIVGKVHAYGDDIDTDRIIAGKYTKTLDFSQLAAHVLEDLDPSFKTTVQAGDMLAGGENFGCGSSREQAPVAIKAAGVSVVIARSFARIFYRNAINIGLTVVEAPTHTLQTGQLVRVDLTGGIVENLTTGETYPATRMPDVMLNILNAGGLVNYLREKGDFVP